jgi:thioredoxin-like negative regulator of GroEL
MINITTTPLQVSGGDIDASRFDELVIDDSRVWAVEFYSPMCGSCTEFSPTWHSMEGKFKSIESGSINIDSKEGMVVAQRLGVLDEGLPNIR